MGVQKVTTTEEYGEIIQQDVLVVIDYFAVWCPPCRMIAPVLEKLSESEEVTAKGAKFYQVDVDELSAVAQSASIQAMPTFHGFRKGEKVFELVGANPAKLEELIKANL